MNTAVEKLLELSGPPLSESQSPRLAGDPSATRRELAQLLNQRNGWFAFESALHIFPAGPVRRREQGYSLDEWNGPDLWISSYGSAADGPLYFAEDGLGCQFCINGETVSRFDPETAQFEDFALGLSGWAERIIADYEVETAYTLVHEWQAVNRPLAAYERLIPKTPFIFGGEFEVSNLYAIDAAEGMRFRAHIEKQIRGLPEGAQVRFKIV